VFKRLLNRDQPSWTIGIVKKGFSIGLGIINSSYKRDDNLRNLPYKIVLFSDGELWNLDKKYKIPKGFTDQ
jgi:hypothetical protein